MFLSGVQNTGITTLNMEVKQVIESTHSVISGYDQAMDIGLFSAVVKANLHQQKK